MAARDGAVNARRASLCQLRDLIITAPEPLRSELRPLTRGRLLKRLAAVRPARHASVELCGTLLALSSLARRIEQLTAEERDLETEIATLARELAPQLLNEPGVGPLAAGQLLLSWSHPAASVAKLPSRASPAAYRSLPRQARRSVTGSTAAATASSTCALHRIAVTQGRVHPPARAYLERKQNEGKSRREAIRCLKRQLARTVYTTLKTESALT